MEIGKSLTLTVCTLSDRFVYNMELDAQCIFKIGAELALSLPLSTLIFSDSVISGRSSFKFVRRQFRETPIMIAMGGEMRGRERGGGLLQF